MRSATRSVLAADAPRHAGWARSREAIDRDDAFVPLSPADAALPDEGMQVMRVRFSRDALAGFGWPIPDDGAGREVQADVLVGDGDAFVNWKIPVHRDANGLDVIASICRAGEDPRHSEVA